MSQGWENWTNALGIRADEAHRKKPSTDKRVTRWFPLEDTTKRDVLDFWERMPFDLNIPAGYGNCTGCFLKSESFLSSLARDSPKDHQWWVDQEDIASSLTKSPGGARFRKSFTRRELGEFVERQGDFAFEDGVLCQADDGECTG